MPPIPVNIAVEDPLSETLLRTLMVQTKKPYAIGTCYSEGGFGYLKKNLSGFNAGARFVPMIILTDLDRYACVPELIHDWFERERNPNLLLRVAVKEIEAWVLAHRKAFLSFFEIPRHEIPHQVDKIDDPKRFLIELVRKSPNQERRRRIVPPVNSTRTQGPDYNACLTEFVQHEWKATEAIKLSASIQRTWKALNNFSPTWSD
jgi:hypothetical protein